jgi:nitrite reductase/ring-hydroxylating ferredoxin subunit
LAVAGVLTALVAAVPGFIDYFRTVPPKSSGRERATRHMLLNLATVALFAVAVWLRKSSAAPPTTLTLALEAVGAAMLTVAGAMGGTLVTRNQISVDHRYARAGRWSEETLERLGGSTVLAARSGELEVDQMKLLHIDGKRVVLARSEDGYAAFDDGCTHKGGSLAGGAMICGTVQCPWHGSQFDVQTGRVRAGPAKEGIKTYRVEERDGEVRVLL